MSPTFGKCYDPTGALHGIPTFPWKTTPPTATPPAANSATADYGPVASRWPRR